MHLDFFQIQYIYWIYWISSHLGKIPLEKFSEIRESNKSLKHDPILSHMSCWHRGSIVVFYTRVDRFDPFYCDCKYFCHWIQRIHWKHLGKTPMILLRTADWCRPVIDWELWVSRLVIDSFSIYAAEWHSLNVQSVFISVETFAQYNDKLPISTIFYDARGINFDG